MGFIAYQRLGTSDGPQTVRIYLECMDQPVPDGADRTARAISGSGPGLSFSFAVDLLFPGGDRPCELRGIDGILPLKKFYKLVFSLEERAREHGNDWKDVTGSPASLLEHLRYTHNARDLTGQPAPLRRGLVPNDVKNAANVDVNMDVPDDANSRANDHLHRKGARPAASAESNSS